MSKSVVFLLHEFHSVSLTSEWPSDSVLVGTIQQFKCCTTFTRVHVPAAVISRPLSIVSAAVTYLLIAMLIVFAAGCSR